MQLRSNQTALFLATVPLFVLAFAGMTAAATTVSTDISTGGSLTVSGTSTLSGVVIPTGKTLYYGTDVLIDSAGNLNATVLPLQDTASNLNTTVPSSGERVYETDTAYTKIGDGSTSVGNLRPLNPWIATSSNGITFGAGRVGLGLSAPQFDLDVNGANKTIGNSTGVLNISNSSSHGQINIGDTSSAFGGGTIVLTQTEAQFTAGSDGSGLVVQSSDVVDLNYSSDPHVHLESTFDGFGINGSGGWLVYAVTGTNRVGIASSTPWKTLSVDGTVALNGLDSSTAGNAVCILSNKDVVTAGNTTCVTSSRKTKHDIQPITSAQAREVLLLQPSQYVNNEGGDARFGFIADEAAAVDPKLVEYAASDIPLFDGQVIRKGEPSGFDYIRYSALLTKLVQDQDRRIGQLEAEVHALQAR